MSQLKSQNPSHTQVTLGLTNPKSPENVGMILRAAGCYAAHQIFYSGTRYDRARQFYTDTRNIHEKIPLQHTDNLLASAPAGASIVAVELVEGAIPLMHFTHPDNAFYIFGPEDGSLTTDVLAACNHVVYIPTIGCLNLAASVNVVLYDRLLKNPDNAIETRPIAQNRDVNSQAKIRRDY